MKKVSTIGLEAVRSPRSAEESEISGLAQPEAPLEHHFRQRHYQKYRTDQRVEPKECGINPFQAPAPGQPVLQQQAQEDNQEANHIGYAKAAEQSEAEEQGPHDHMRKESSGQRVSRSPRYHQRVQPA